MESSPSSPKYRQVFDQLRQEILSGKYREGQKLPSEADLVKRFGASRITVGRAVRDLREEGLVERRAGSGTYARGVQSTGGRGLSFGLLIPDLGRTEIFEPICQGMTDAPGEHTLLLGNSKLPLASMADRAWELCQQYIARKVSGVFFTPLDLAQPRSAREGDGEPHAEREDYDLAPLGAGGEGERMNERIVAAFAEAGIPVVLLDRDYLPYPRRSALDLVSIDNWRTGFLATEHLIRLGCRRIGFVTSATRRLSSVEERIAGYREALYLHQLPVEAALLQRLPAEGEPFMEGARPEALVCVNDVTAGRLMRRLLADGMRIPKDVRIVGMDDVTYANLLPVPLTTMHQPCRDLGMAAVGMMLERIQHPEMPGRHVELECRLVVRESCGGS